MRTGFNSITYFNMYLTLNKVKNYRGPFPKCSLHYYYIAWMTKEFWIHCQPPFYTTTRKTIRRIRTWVTKPYISSSTIWPPNLLQDIQYSSYYICGRSDISKYCEPIVSTHLIRAVKEAADIIGWTCAKWISGVKLLGTCRNCVFKKCNDFTHTQED